MSSLHAGAVEAQDPWAVAALHWLLARPDQALQGVLHAPWPPQQQSSFMPEQHVSRLPTLQPALLLLDFLYHASASGAAPLPLETDGALCALRTLAQGSVAALSMRGLPGLALEALALAEAWSQPAAAQQAAQGEHNLLQSWKAELAAGMLLRGLLGALCCLNALASPLLNMHLASLSLHCMPYSHRTYLTCAAQRAARSSGAGTAAAAGRQPRARVSQRCRPGAWRCARSLFWRGSRSCWPACTRRPPPRRAARPSRTCRARPSRMPAAAACPSARSGGAALRPARWLCRLCFCSLPRLGK